ncbi:unnamed protein product [Adineta steineri]|uniref:Uncharacterized protein n=1 Tax=Adineta steineri TaxID=433720 RepID=A0A819HEL3_9BILA|nr:unnamed protein product [Adineta steineri]CAF3902437.1 unnamed protein product [Adineta steineri]
MKTSLRSDTTIDLLICSEVPKTSECHSWAYTISANLPVFTNLLGLNTSAENHHVPRTCWRVLSSIRIAIHDQLQTDQEILMNKSNNTFNWFITFEIFLAIPS